MANKNFKVNGLTAQVGGAKTEDSNVRYILSANTETVIDTTSLTNLGSVVYEIDIEQGTKRRRSVVALETDGTLVSSTEYGVVSVGDAISGISIAVDANSGNARLKATITDASTTPAFFNILKKVYEKNLAPWGLGSVSATDAGTSRPYNNGAASITFTTVSGSPSANLYTATSNPGGFTGSGTSSPITVTGLQANTSYTFDVTPLNANGSGITSSTGSITATTVSDSPTIGTATKASDTSASVTFTAPANNGGSSITSYTATSTPGSFTGTSATSPITVTGMTTATYTFTVTATNSNGISAPSAATASVFIGPEPGATWTSSASGLGGASFARSVAYGNGKWLLGINAWPTERWSTNGITWTNDNYVITPYGTSSSTVIRYANSTWMLVTENGNSKYSTNDGANWTAGGAVSTSYGLLARQHCTLEYGNGIWMFGGYKGAIRTSTNGVSWTNRDGTFGTGSFSNRMSSAVYGPDKWVAGGYGYGWTNSIRTSTDNGATWVTRSFASSAGGGSNSKVAYGKNKYISFSGSNGASQSTDGITWSAVTTGATSNPSLLVYGNGYFFAHAFSQLRTSSDGVTWVTRDSAFQTGMGSTYSLTDQALGNDNTRWVGSVNGGSGYIVYTNA